MANEGQFGNQISTLERNINSELTCGVCLELFTAPVMLPCSHNFCQQCINSMLDVNMSMSEIQYGPLAGFHCPLCQHSIPISRYQFNKWPVNRALENIVDLYKKSAPCEIFDDSWYADLELTTGICKRHEKPLNKFCDSCTEVLCSMCEKSEHSSQRAKHRVEPVQHAVRTYQTDIAKSLNDLKKKLMPLNARINKLERLLEEIQVNADHSRRQIDEQFSELMKLTRSKQTDLMQKIHVEVKEQREPITEDLNQCRSVQNTVQDLIKKLSHIRRIKNTTLLIQTMKNVYKQLDTLTGFDIDHCLRGQVQHSTSCPSYELHTQHAYTAIENLNWETSHNTEKGSSSDCRHISVHTQTMDVMETTSQAVGNHGDTTVQNSTGKSVKSNNSKSSESSVISESFRENSFDEPDSDMLASGGNGPVGDGHIGRRDNTKVTDQHKDTQYRQGQKRHDCEKQVLSKQCNDPDSGDFSPGFKSRSLGDVSPRVKGPSSYPKDVKNSSGDNKKDVIVSSTGKGKRSMNDNNHAAAIKSFVARRRTMSPSVSATSLESRSMSYSGEKLSLHPDTARRNASSPALKSLEASFELGDTNDNKKRADSKQRQEADGASAVSDVPTNMNPMSSADTVDTKSSRSMSASSSRTSITPLPKQKSFTIQPIDLKLDLNLDEDGSPSSKITNV